MTSSLVHTRRILNGYTHILRGSVLRGSADVLQRPLETSADSSILISPFGCIARRCFHLSHRISTALLAFGGSKLTTRNGFEPMPNSIQSSRTNAPSKGAGRGRLYQCCTRPVVSPILRRPGRRNGGLRRGRAEAHKFIPFHCIIGSRITECVKINTTNSSRG